MSYSFSSDSYSDSEQEDEPLNEVIESSSQNKKQIKKKKGEANKQEGDDIVLKIKIDDDSPPKRDKEYIFLVQGDNADFIIQSFVHPKTGKLCKYALRDEGRKIFEIQRFKRIPSSYFINEEVKDDGSLFMTTQVDPLFMILRRLDQCRNRKSDLDSGVFVSLTEIFSDKNYSPLQNAVTQIDLISDEKKLDDVLYYRLNDQKLCNWLRHKVDNIAVHFEKNASEAMGLVRAQASGYRSKKNETVEITQLLQIACGILSEYLPSSMLKLLKDTYGSELNSSLVLKPQSKEQAGDGDLYGDAKYGKVSEKRKSNAVEEKKDSTPDKKRKIKAHEKVDTRKIAPLTSFFTKK